MARRLCLLVLSLVLVACVADSNEEQTGAASAKKEAEGVSSASSAAGPFVTATAYPGVPACEASVLSGEAGGSDGAHGMTLFRLVFINSGNVTCILRGRPGLRAVDEAGKSHPLATSEFYFFPQPAPPRPIATGERSGLLLVTSVHCDEFDSRGREPVRVLEVLLTEGGTIRVPEPFNAGNKFNAACGVGVSHFASSPQS